MAPSGGDQPPMDMEVCSWSSQEDIRGYGLRRAGPGQVDKVSIQ